MGLLSPSLKGWVRVSVCPVGSGPGLQWACSEEWVVGCSLEIAKGIKLTVYLDPEILGNLAWGSLQLPFPPCPSPMRSPSLSDCTYLLHLLLLTVGANALKGLFSVICIPALLLIRLLGLGGVEGRDLGAPR